jgi:hypothetical protein
MLRYLRIAASAACAIACVLLIVLWVRSYWRSDLIQGPIVLADGFSVNSIKGRLMFSVWRAGADPPITAWDFLSMKVSRVPFTDHLPPPALDLGTTATDTFLHVPHWLLALTAGWTAGMLAISRFSTRTLLIAITLLAVAFGVATYRWPSSPGPPPTSPQIYGTPSDEVIS